MSTVLALVCAIAVSGMLVLPAGSGSGCMSLDQATHGPQVRVTALPGVDLRPIAELPGLSAASGPYPGVASSIRSGRTEVSTWIEGRPGRRAVVDRPFMVAGSWARGGGIVVEQGLARRLGLRTGQRTRVATTRGALTLRVTGIAATTSVARMGDAPGLAYVLPRDLRRIAPAPVHGSTMLLRARGQGSPALAAWLEKRYPGPQAHVARDLRDRCLSR